MLAGVVQNDPSELLEVFDAAGQPTGQALSRGEIHRRGLWHQAFHCWIRRAGGSQVVLQRRALTKDTFPGKWDAAAAGHWRFGESAAQAAREIAEELGLAVPFGQLRFVGREVSDRAHSNGLIDREHHQVYVLHLDLSLDQYHPDPAEVVGVGAFAGADLLALVEGRLERAAAIEAVAVAPDGRVTPTPVTIGRDDLVPLSDGRLQRLLAA
jgi:isopentenyldiphosphate isomerase